MATNTTGSMSSNVSRYQPTTGMMNHPPQYISSHHSRMTTKQQPQQKQEKQQQQNDTYSLPRSVSNDTEDNDDCIDDGKENRQAPSSYKKNHTDTTTGTTGSSTNAVQKPPVTSSSTTTVVEKYLVRYEQMIRQQEIEVTAVMAHLFPCIQRLIGLINNNSNNYENHSTTNATSTTGTNMQLSSVQLHHEISYHQLYKAYQQLEQIRAKPERSSSSSKMNTNSNNMTISATECMTTDRQLMMVLRTLTQTLDTNSHTIGTTDPTTTLNYNYGHTIDATTLNITWAEFIQCYKVCIYGMITLQDLPKGSMARLRARDRSLSMIALFGPSATLFSSDLFMSPNHMNQLSISTNSTPALKVIPDNLTSSITASPSTLLRRRPWFKKRTKRILPYVVITLMFLLVALGYLYLPTIMQRRELSVLNHHDDGSIVCQGKTNHHLTVGQNIVAVPSFPSTIVTIETRTNDIHTPSSNNSSTTGDIQAKQIQYHPLLGIWSNF